MLVDRRALPGVQALDRAQQAHARQLAVAALFGATGTLTSPAGWVNVNAYANFAAADHAAADDRLRRRSAIAGQNEDGTLGLLVVLPLARRESSPQKIATMIVQALILDRHRRRVRLRRPGVRGDPRPLARRDRHRSPCSLLGVDLGLVAMAIGAATGSRGTAIGITGRARRRLLPDQLARTSRALDPPAAVRVAVLLGGRQPATHRRRRARIVRGATRRGDRRRDRSEPRVPAPRRSLDPTSGRPL